MKRLSNRRIDPQSGIFYNLEVNPPKDEQTASRLTELKEDKEASVKSRCAIWMSHVPVIEEAYKNMLINVQSDKLMDEITDFIADAIQNPIF